MDLERCKALVLAVDTGSLSAAANKMNVTISGMSRMMTTLEKEMGFALLHRQHEGVVPTQNCKQILPYIRDFIHSGDICEQVASKITGLNSGIVTIGVAHRTYYESLARITKKFQAQYPNIDVQIRNGYSTNLLSRLNRHQLDFCIISFREGNHEWLPIFKDEMVAWIPEGHDLAQRESIPISYYEKEAYISTYPGKDTDNERLFKRCRITPNTKLSTLDAFATFSMVDAGLGISIENRLTARKWIGKVKLLPLDPPQFVEIGIAMLKDRTPAADMFMDFVQNELKKGQK